eukprot:TRINITY_DN55379_c0_g1_i1.p2 TRINITY_DN55379_c0_g1~~TRINITY_DN55379_c0_g1_i1.p2  ORF type:complete len:363 (+),score=83.51 TRINITY_DN55379_c0_g1_i1:116-1090(+)
MDAARVEEILSSAGDAERLPKGCVDRLRDFALSSTPESEPLRVDCKSEREAKDVCHVAKRLRLRGRIDFGPAPDPDDDDTEEPSESFAVCIWHKGAQVPEMTVREPRRPRRDPDARPPPEELMPPDRSPRGNRGGGGGGLGPGDWRCPVLSCQFVNLARFKNSSCHRCGARRESTWEDDWESAGYGGQPPGALTAADLESQLLAKAQHRGGPQVSLGDWKETLDPKTGKSYYYNTKTRETTWDRPAGMGVSSPARSPQRQPGSQQPQMQTVVIQQGYGGQGMWSQGAAAGGWPQGGGAPQQAGGYSGQQQQPWRGPPGTGQGGW